MVFDVFMDNNVLGGALVASLEAAGNAGADGDVEEGSLVHFHQRFGHLSLDTIERITADPNSGKRLTSRNQMACVPCMEGK